MKFLSVDDSSTMRKIISLALTGAGHTVEEAENGLLALEKLKKGPVDCILLDINMPEMNGIEFLKARKKFLKKGPAGPGFIAGPSPTFNYLK